MPQYLIISVCIFCLTLCYWYFKLPSVTSAHCLNISSGFQTLCYYASISVKLFASPFALLRASQFEDHWYKVSLSVIGTRFSSCIKSFLHRFNANFHFVSCIILSLFDILFKIRTSYILMFRFSKPKHELTWCISCTTINCIVFCIQLCCLIPIMCRLIFGLAHTHLCYLYSSHQGKCDCIFLFGHLNVKKISPFTKVFE